MKRFIIKTMFYFIPFICMYGGHKIIQPYFSGDLGALGQIPFGKTYNENLKKNYLKANYVKDTLIVSFQKFKPDNTSGIFTFGDSYSLQGIFGYQNYLAHLLGNNIQNILRREGYNQIETAVSLLNSGIIDSSNCQAIIFELVDRNAIWWLSDIDFEILFEPPQKKENQSNKKSDRDSELYDLTSWFRLQVGYDNPVFKHDLKQDCFTHNYFPHKLFHIKDDFVFTGIKPADIAKAKENLVLLNNFFSEKGIKIIFLIGADKYDVYRPFMTDDRLPVDTTTDELSNLTGVCILNTKWLLQEMVRSGEQDVYMVNDTHWSYKASEVIAQRLFNRLYALTD